MKVGAQDNCIVRTFAVKTCLAVIIDVLHMMLT